MLEGYLSICNNEIKYSRELNGANRKKKINKIDKINLSWNGVILCLIK